MPYCNGLMLSQYAVYFAILYYAMFSTKLAIPFIIQIIPSFVSAHNTRGFLGVDKYEHHNFRQFGNEQSVC